MDISTITFTLVLFPSLIQANYKEDPINYFAQDLFEYMTVRKENPILCPLSAYLALALCYEGSSGTTRTLLRNILQLPSDEHAYKESNRQLSGDSTFILANNIFIKTGYEISDTFRSVTTKKYNADVQNVDFTNRMEGARLINTWVSDRTNRNVKDLISESDLNEYTRLILVNTIYFKNQWVIPFKEVLQDTFHVSPTHTVNCEMMKTTGEFQYEDDDKFGIKLVRIPYQNDFSLVIMAPYWIGETERLEKSLDKNNLRRIMDKMHLRRLEIFIPKFKLEATIDLQDPLEKLGLSEIFGSDADFSLMLSDKSEPLHVSKIIQKVIIDVNENGTEATGVTGAVIRKTRAASMEEVITFRADRPFWFYVVDKNDRRIFMGILHNPTSGIQHDEL